MSNETLQTLNTNTLIGLTSQRGHAWHYQATLQGDEPNHYDGAIPVADVSRRLFSWTAVQRPVAVQVPASMETMTHLDAGGVPARWAIQADRVAIARDDNDHVMGIFTPSYTAHQYQQWLLESVSTLIGDTLAISSAGLLRAGAIAWVEVSVPETIHLDGLGISYRPNLLAVTSFDGSVATTYKRTVTMTVCDNTLAVARSESDAGTYRVKHTAHSRLRLRLDEATRALNIVHQVAGDFEAHARALCQRTVSPAQWQQFLDAHTQPPAGTGVPSPRAISSAQDKRDALNRLWDHDPRVSPWRGTAFGVRQAVNTWAHHEQRVRGSRSERNALAAVTGTRAKGDAEALAQLDLILSA